MLVPLRLAHSCPLLQQVRRCGEDTKYVAKVLAIGTECDIALLTVEEEEFWKGVEAVKFGALPRLQDTITVVGYPIGGDTISVTQVTRVYMYRSSVHSIDWEVAIVIAAGCGF